MEIGRLIRSQIQGLVIPGLCLCLAGYFAYHLVAGDRGLAAYGRLTHQIRAAEQQAAEAHQQREDLDHRVEEMRSEHLDPDLLDERARAALNLVGPNEVVIQEDDTRHLP